MSRIKEYNLSSEQISVLEDLHSKETHFPLDVKIHNGEVVEIFFWQNWIEKLPDNIGCLKFLKKISLGMNHLSTLPDSFRQLTLLEQLFLDGNDFKTFPEQVLDLPSLKWLDLSANKLEKIPNGLEKLQSLETLNLGYNHNLKYLPQSISKLKKLKTLRLDQCYDVIVPESILEMKNIEIIGLDDLKEDANGNINIQLLIREYGTPAVDYYANEELREKVINPNVIVIQDEKITINFRYPLHNPATFEYESKGGFTRLDLYRCIYQGYKKIYDEEEAEVGDPGTYERVMNRKPSFGKYGIWGHYLGELWIERIIYNPKTKTVDMSIGS